MRQPQLHRSAFSFFRPDGDLSFFGFHIAVHDQHAHSRSFLPGGIAGPEKGIQHFGQLRLGDADAVVGNGDRDGGSPELQQAGGRRPGG